MADQTSIEWTDATWNPTTGCDRVSPGCDNCYAMTLAPRLKAMGSAHYQTDGNPETSGPGFGVAVHPDALDKPLRWKKPRRIFVNSMSDLFHKNVPDGFIADVFAVMALADRHTFQVLTKRHGRMRALLRPGGGFIADVSERIQARGGDGFTWPLPNVWLGVSVESQQWADIRIPALCHTPAAVRFLSCEPLLGPVDLHLTAEAPHVESRDPLVVGSKTWRRPIDWVIAGGESGHGARPMHPDWARSLRDQCADAHVPFLFKQWGEWSPAGYGARVDIAPDQELSLTREHWFPTPAPDDPRLTHTLMKRVGKGKAGRLLDGRTHDEFPTQPCLAP